MSVGLRERKVPARLSAREAERLWRAWKEEGDRGARDRLVESYVPMVKYLASRKIREVPAHLELDDLVSCGMLAVVAAVERFDPAKGASFEQYAWMRVSGAIVDELRKLDRVSRATRAAARTIERVYELAAQAGGYPSRDDLAVALGVTVEEVEEILVELDRAHGMVSLDVETHGDHPQPVTLGDSIADRHDRHGERLDLLEAMRLMRETLTERELVVLLRRAAGEHGLDLAAELGVTESRVSQILSGAQKKMRKAA